MLAAILTAQTDIQSSLCAHSEHLRPLGRGIIIRHSVYCHLQVHAVGDELVVHPVLLPTPFQPVPPNLAQGAPITLLPYATPAYYIATYHGPTSALAAQFRAQGMSLPSSPRFIIAWVAVENSQGEDKGILIIYPTDLCLASTLQRPFLQYIPELPAQLHQSPLQSTVSRPPLLSSPTSDSLQAFRALTVNKTKPLRYVAAEVGGYVDAVARDRERERERLKRERESAASSPKMSRPSAPQPLVSAPPPAPPPPPITPSVQNFYPSPPQMPLPPAPSSHDLRTSPTIPLATPPAPPPPLPPPTLTQPTYDPWPSSADPFDLDMVMDMDFDMGINFGSDPASSSAAAMPMSNSGDVQHSAFEDAFTDDDFSFFDRPARPLMNGASVGTPAMSPPGVHHHFGAVETPAQTQTHQQGWTPGAFNLMDPFTTPRSIDDPPDLVHSSPSPDTQSPGFVPATPNVHLEHGYAPSPSGSGSLLLRTPSGSSSSLGAGVGGLGGAFEPIPFAAYHRLADGKYAVGKFAFKFAFGSAPARSGWSSDGGEGQEGWRARYDAVTDPRVGVVRKLIGVKRKSDAGLGLGIGRPPPTPTWEWEEGEGGRDGEMDVDDSDYDSDTGDEEGEEDREMGFFRGGYGDGYDEEEDSPMVSRPSTPPPSYLPLGPTLLQTRFEHRLLLPLSVPLRSPSASGGVAGTPGASTSLGTSSTSPITATGTSTTGAGGGAIHAHTHAQQMASVPTPVSPAAMAGAEEEKARAMEAAGWAVAREVVENPVWGVAWRAAGARGATPGFGGAGGGFCKAAMVFGAGGARVGSRDVRAMMRALEGVKDALGGEGGGIRVGVSMEDLFGLDSTKPIYPLEEPMISIAKGDVVLDMKPTSLRFWEKLGLGPKAGRKDFTAYVLFEDDAMGVGMGGERARAEGGDWGRKVWVEGWMEGLRDVYKAKRYGTMSFGRSNMCVDGDSGLVPLRYDATFRKTLTNLIASLPAALKSQAQSKTTTDTTLPLPSTLVVFLVLPFAIMSLASPVLRQVLGLCKKLLVGNSNNWQVVVQLVPEAHVVRGMEAGLLSSGLAMGGMGPGSGYGYGSQMEWMAASVYNRILVPVDRERTGRAAVLQSSMQPHSHGHGHGYSHALDTHAHPNLNLNHNPNFSSRMQDVRRLFVSPSFTLARPARYGVTYVRAAHTPLDVLDRYTVLHVGYGMSGCGRWVFACCVDQRGEGYDLRVWLGDAGTGAEGGGAGAGTGGQGGQEEGPEDGKDSGWAWADVVRKVWEFGMGFAKKANLEWRVVFARLGAMGHKEMNAWSTFLNENVVNSKEQPPLHHYVVCVVPDAPWMFTPSMEGKLPLVIPSRAPASTTTSASGGSAVTTTRSPTISKTHLQQQQHPQQQPAIFTDVSSATYAVFPTRRIPISVPPTLDDLGLTKSFVPEDSSSSSVDGETSTSDPAPSSSSTPSSITPQASSILIRVPRASSLPPSSSSSSSSSAAASLSFSSASMIHTHFLLGAHSASYTQHAQTAMSDAGRVASDEKLLEDVTKGYYELGVLAKVRWGLDGVGGGGGTREGLPFHLAAVDGMCMALDGSWDGSGDS